MPVPVTAEILNRGQQHPARITSIMRVSPRGEAHAVARLQQRGRAAGGIEQLQFGAADQLPAARRGRRINPGLLAADADRPGRHFQPRRRAARRVQRGFEAAHVGEPRLEAEKEHDVSPCE